MSTRDFVDWITAIADPIVAGVRARVRGGINGVAQANDEGVVVHVASSQVGGAGGTASNFGAAFPAVGTAAGGSDGTNMVPFAIDPVTGRLKVDVPAGAAGLTDTELRASPVPVDTGLSPGLTDTQLRAAPVPVSGTFFPGTQPVSAAALPLPAGASTEATLALIKAKTDNLDVALSTRAVTGLTDTQLRAAAVPISAAALPLPAGAATEATLAAISAAVRAEDSVAADLDKGIGFLVIRKATPVNLSGADGDYEFLQMNAGRLWTSAMGEKTNNNAAPGATKFGSLIAIANEALPAYTEGNLVLPATDLRGVLRSVGVPMAALGFYSWQGITGGYTGLAANTPLWSMRWGDATRFGILLRVEVMVFTSTAATAASITERQLIIARGFTASDTGGTAATLTGNNQKMRTSMGTSLLTDMRIGAPITAGTRTLDAAPIASTMGWSALLSTGVTIGAFGGIAVAAASAIGGGGQFQKLWDAIYGQEHPIVFAQNEGAVVRIGAAQPTTVVQQTLVRVVWAEANKVY